MDSIKEAFKKIKEDIFLLKEAILQLKQEVDDLKTKQNIENSPYFSTNKSDTFVNNFQHISNNPTHNPTLPSEKGGLKIQNLTFSTGNRGVPTDTSTNKPTHQHTTDYEKKSALKEYFYPQNRITIQPESFDHFPKDSYYSRASELLSSLDSIKKEIRLKFKELTPQEMLVFSSIYQLEEQGQEVTHKVLSSLLNLSESSVREYVNKLILKGIPIKKIKKSNKILTISISSDLKKIASLSTIIKLREL